MSIKNRRNIENSTLASIGLLIFRMGAGENANRSRITAASFLPHPEAIQKDKLLSDACIAVLKDMVANNRVNKRVINAMTPYLDLTS